MLPDSKLVVRKFPDCNEIIIYPLFDEHIGASTHLQKRWEQLKKTILNTPNAYCIIGGDMMNNSTIGSVGTPYADIIPPAKQKEWLCKELLDLAKANKIICGVPGNHERRDEKYNGYNPMYDIFCRIGLEHLYRDVRCYVKLTVGKNAYTGLITHGSFGGKTAGSVVDKLEKFSGDFQGLDFIVVGHAHKGGVARPSKSVVNPYANVVSEKEVLVLAATSGVAREKYADIHNYSGASNKPMLIKLSGGAKDIKYEW